MDAERFTVRIGPGGPRVGPATLDEVPPGAVGGRMKSVCMHTLPRVPTIPYPPLIGH